MKFPKRKHTGCDPMCDECQEWMYRVMELMIPVAHEAMKAFWNVIYARVPECPADPIDKHGAELLIDACEEAAGHWAVENLPEPSVSVASAKREKVLRFEPASKKPQPSAIFLPFGK